MRKKLPRTQRMIDAIETMFWFNKGKIATLQEQKVQIEALLGQSIVEWAEKTDAQVVEEWSLNRVRRFYQQDWRLRWDNKSERVIVHMHDSWVHKRIYKRYLEMQGRQGVEEAKKFILGAIHTLEPNIQGGAAIVNGYLETLAQIEAGIDVKQLSLFSNPEAEEQA